MREVPLLNAPNQRVETTIDGVNYSIQLRTVQSFTTADIYADGEILKAGSRCIPGKPLIPYPYLTRGGNFYFYCLNDDYPYYEYFGITQKLVYLTDEEIAGLNK